MSVIDLEALLKEVSPDAPAGADCEFDPGYFELERMTQGTPESVMGNEVKAGKEPEFAEVKAAALAMFDKTRDLRVAMILAAALLKEDGLPGFAEGLGLVRGFVEKLWDQFYPKLDPTDNNDPTIRMNILKGFDGDAAGGDNSRDDLYKFRLRIREAILTNSKQKIGRFCYRDIQIAKGELPAPVAKEGQPPIVVADMKLINAAFQDTESDHLQTIQTALEEIQGHVEAINATLTEKVGAGVGPGFERLSEPVKQIKDFIAGQLASRGIGEAPPAEEGGSGDGAPGPAAGAGRTGAALSGEISSRSEVIQALDKICEYYSRYEPASPVPIFMERAKRLVTMNFVDLIKDLAPEAMAKIDVFTGSPAGDGSSAPSA